MSRCSCNTLPKDAGQRPKPEPKLRFEKGRLFKRRLINALDTGSRQAVSVSLLKTPGTIGNCQRPVFSLGVYLNVCIK